MGRPNSSTEQLRYSAVEAFTALNSSSFVPSSICRAHSWALALSLSLGACSTLQPQTQPVFNDLRIAAAGTGEDPSQSVSYHVLAAEMAAGRNRPATGWHWTRRTAPQGNCCCACICAMANWLKR